MSIRTGGLAILALTASVACAQEGLHGTVETFFQNRDGTRGFVHQMSWEEFHYRPSANLRGTLSLTQFPTRDTLDEACVEFEHANGMLRVGRFRTAFGFSDWSELLYNGFNHLPLPRTVGLADGLSLLRQDAGVEATFFLPQLQIQAALFDPRLDDWQLAPKRIDHGSLRLQSFAGPWVLGVDLLSGFDTRDRIYGLDVRWSMPKLLVKGEVFTGDGEKSNGRGFYVDAEYRLPRLPRTQAVARFEGTRVKGSEFRLYTIGVRQVLFNLLSLNLNYGWAAGIDPTFFGTPSPTGWSARSLLRFTF